ncbi:uncharacterized protein LOC143209135 [Lasioglossum baleicum]|uniref:uncharacterized protein LOC143209135 n=1 Tax=Lasioglossum baleicum TaxID=434251 RepID=UPI003FCD04E1
MEDNFARDAKELWAVYAWWSCVLVLKMNALSWFTGRIRVSRQKKEKWLCTSLQLILERNSIFIRHSKRTLNPSGQSVQR